jgi:hypothetical protein
MLVDVDALDYAARFQSPGEEIKQNIDPCSAQQLVGPAFKRAYWDQRHR